MTNKLIIKNFLIFKDVEIEINHYTVLIGPQASGKSIVAKLLHLFYQIPRLFYIGTIQSKSLGDINQAMISTFNSVFPNQTLGNSFFSIELITQKGVIAFNNSSFNKTTFLLPDHFSEIFNDLKSYYKEITDNKNLDENQKNDLFRKKWYSQEWGFINNSSYSTFIPAGRSFFSFVSQNVFTFLMNDLNIDYFIKSFGSEYERIKHYSLKRNEDVQKKLLKGVFEIKNNKEYIHNEHSNFVFDTEITNASSGQQELLPIVLTLLANYNSFYVIEEPEVHIFPDTQYDLIRFIVSKIGEPNSGTAFLFTTHSPYVLTTINNLAYAGYLENKFANRKDKLDKLDLIYPKKERIPFGKLSAYFFSDGSVKSIIDNETMLINSEEIDHISNVTEEAFSNLMDLDNE